jgi:hypothetical protein
LYDLLQCYDARVFHLGCVPAEELPAMIVIIVGNVEDRYRTLQNLGKSHDRAVSRLIERPTFWCRILWRRKGHGERLTAWR